MRTLIALLALAGVVVFALALQVHYSTATEPCDINAKWDCGIVNHSPFAVLAGVPVAVIGMAGYVFLALLAVKRAYLLFLGAALVGLSFSLYLAHVEASILGVWCIYCVASLAVISLLTLLGLGTVLLSRIRSADTVH